VAVQPILEYPDPRLSRRSLPVTAFDAELAGLVDDLVGTLASAGGIGLSAPQLGVLRRVALADLSGGTDAPEVYVNPAIVARSAFGLVEESCLSVPGVTGSVIRATQLRVRAQDPSGQPFERDLEAMHAVCLQHEIDHLDGTLFIDRLFWPRRLLIRARARRRARLAGAATVSGATAR
jgi:peptide deformylase